MPPPVFHTEKLRGVGRGCVVSEEHPLLVCRADIVCQRGCTTAAVIANSHGTVQSAHDHNAQHGNQILIGPAGNVPASAICFGIGRL